MPIDVEKNTTFDIPGVEIFSVGTWNDTEWSLDDLQEMVKAFNENKGVFKPYLKLGHNDDQKLVQDDGLPAAGWINNLYIRGEKLVADFVDIPKKIYQLIKNGAYKKVSAEIFINTRIKEKAYPRMLAAVALLGSDTPAVMNLNDILAMYVKKFNADIEKLKIQNDIEFVTDSKTNQGKGKNMSKTENEVKLEFDLKTKEDELKATAEKLQAVEQAKVEAEKELEALKQFKAEAQKREIELIAEQKKAAIEKFVTELQSEKLCTPAMKSMLCELLGDEKQEYSIKQKDEEKKYSKQDLVKETLKLFKLASEVNFEESSEDGEDSSKKSDETKLDEEIKKYAAEHKLSYGKAAKIILAQANKQ